MSEQPSVRSGTVQVLSDQHGTLEVDESTVIELPVGLPGFPTARRVVILDADDVGAYCRLQIVGMPSVSFLAVAPVFFFADYVPEIPDDEAIALDIRGDDDAQLLCLVTIDGDDITANLMAPIVLNVRTRVARQVVLHDQQWGLREPLGIHR